MAGFKDLSIFFNQRSSNPPTPVAGHAVLYALDDGSIMAMTSNGVPFRVDNALVESLIASVSGSLQSQIDSISAGEVTSSLVASVSGILQSHIDANYSVLVSVSGSLAATDSALQTQVTTVSSSLAAEVSARIAADLSQLSQLVSVSGTLAAADAAEQSARIAADSALQTQVTTISSDLISEISSRIAGDAASHTELVSVSGALQTSIQSVSVSVSGVSGNLLNNYYNKTTSDGLFVHLTGNETISGNKTFNNALTVNGNVTILGNVTTISGSLTAVSSQNLVVSDNIITVNSGETGAGVSLGKSGFTVDRGSLDDASVVYDEVTDRFGVVNGDITGATDPLALLSEVTTLRTDVMSTSAYLQAEIDALTISSSAGAGSVYATLVSVSGNLQSQINTVNSVVVSVSGILQGNINSEAATRAAADASLTTYANNISSALNAEISARIAADLSQLSQLVSVSGTLAAADAAETAARIAADSSLQTQVTTISSDLITEIANRIAGDAASHTELVSVSGALQTEIINLSGSLGTIFQGSVDCNTSQLLYTINHPSIDTSMSFPMVSLSVPASGSALYVQGIVDRNPTNFKVVLSGTPETSGYSINWNLNLSGSAYIIRATPVVALVDGPTITADAAQGDIFDVTIEDNRTIAEPLNPSDGRKIKYRIKQGGAGSYTLTWDPIFYATTSVPLDPPSTPVGNVTHYLVEYDLSRTHWRLLAVSADD